MGQCAAALRAGADAVRVDAPSGTEFFGFAAHSTGCSGVPAPSFTCRIKPDARICLVLYPNPAPAAGTTFRVRLAKPNGQAVEDKELKVPQAVSPTCRWGS